MLIFFIIIPEVEKRKETRGSMREELLKVNQINKSFGPTKALVNVDFTAYRGEVHGLIGENGSGKSTVTTIIAGIQKADSGEMIYKGEHYDPKNALEANAKGICYLMQEQGTRICKKRSDECGRVIPPGTYRTGSDRSFAY